MSSGSQQIPSIGAAPYARLMGVISRYLSVRTAITLVNRSLMELGLTPESMVAADLPGIIELTMSSLRAFVPDAQIDQLVLDLSVLTHARQHSDVVERPRSDRPVSDRPISGGFLRPSERPAPMPGLVEEVALSSRRRR